MDIGRFIIQNAWIIAVALVFWFLYLSNPRQRLAVFLAVLFPGLGHFWIKEHRRGLYFGGIIIVLFLAGMAMANFRNISPLNRHPIWGLAQIPGGLMTLLAALLTHSLKIVRESNLYTVGCLYSGAACLLNILAACDVWDLTESKQQIQARQKRLQK